MSTNSLYPGTTNGVCVTTIIKDKIREYMMSDSSQQIVKSPVEITICEVDKENAADSVIQENKNANNQDPVSTTDLILPSSLDVSIHNSTEPCPHKQDLVNSVRRIGNSLDALLQESKKASHTKPVKKSSLANHQNTTDRLFISSDQLRSRKSVSLHDICEEYIQFITVNSSVSADEEAISTTSENGTERNDKNEEPELEIIPVSAVLPIRHSQISVITINENSPKKPLNTVIKQSVEEMHVAVENECEKSNGENDSNGDKLVSEKEMADTPEEKIFSNMNGVKSVTEEKENDNTIIKDQADEKNTENEPKSEEKLTLSNGVSHNVSDDIEEEDIEEEEETREEAKESPKPKSQEEQPKPSEPSPVPDETVEEKPAADETSPMETDETNDEPSAVAETEVKVVDEPKEPKEETEEQHAEKEADKVEEPVVKEEPAPVVKAVVEEKPNAEKESDQTPPAVEETKMDTSEPENVTETEEPKPEETKSEPPTIAETKPVDSSDKDKEADIKKKKPSEEGTPSEPKIDKKTVVEPEKEAAPVPKVGTTAVTNNVAGVKRKADAADDVEQDRDGGISSSSSTTGSEADNGQDCKRIRFDESIFEEDERERLIREFVERSTESSEEIGKNCDKLQHEIAALSDLARAKELEWNSIMRLLKLKEEMLERILFKKRHLDCQNKPELDANLSKMYKNFVTSSTVSVDQNKSNRNEPSPATNVSNHVTVMPIGGGGSSATSSNGASNSTNQDLFGTKSASSSTAGTETAVGSKSRQHRPILPKPPVTSAQAAQPSSHGPHVPHVAQHQQPQPPPPQQPTLIPHSSQPPQAPSMMTPNAQLLIDQNSVIGEGRQGTIVDVKSIIADFRSKNPDSLPRRGRRNLMPFSNRVPDGGPGPRFSGNTSLMSMANMAMGSGSHVRTSVTSTTHNDHRPNSFFMGQDNPVQTSLGRTEMQMRHPSMDSLMLSVNAAAAAAAASNSSQPNSSTNSNNSNSSSFQEALVKFAKMNEKRDISSNAALHLGSGKGSHLPPPPPYPEVTLHPVLVPQSSGSPPVQNSLLHGILTKSNAAAAAAANQHHPSSTVGNATVMNPTSVGSIQHRPTTFSPTLARLLTAPERNRVNRSAVGSSSRSTKSTLNEILNSKKTRTEVTITPVTTSAACTTKNGSDVVLDDDDESEAADRLVIDEGREVVAESASNVIPADQVPECQGCHKKAAQFVCAGCGNQWYCSRECQVQAWEDHSEMCSG